MRHALPTLLLAAFVAAGVFVAVRGVRADAPQGAHRIVYLHVTGQGPQAKAWYDGGPPSGTAVQAALDKFAADGFRYAAVASSGTGTPASAQTGEPWFVVLLER